MRVAQPSLSKQIKALEAELGAPLFSRARGNVTLTPAGEALLPLARRMLADAETARSEVGELAGLRRGRVTARRHALALRGTAGRRAGQVPPRLPRHRAVRGGGRLP